MRYTLKHKDMICAVFEASDKDVLDCIIFKIAVTHLPLPLKRLVKEGYSEEFIETQDDDYFILNEDGCTLMNDWITDRQIPANREMIEEYTEKKYTLRELLFSSYGCSFTDSYWFEPEGERLCWNDIITYRNKFDNLYLYAGVIKPYQKHNGSLDGQLEKCWVFNGSDVFLRKSVLEQDAILIVRELWASKIYDSIKVVECTSYEVVEESATGIWTTCISKRFTDDDTELITSYDLLEEFNMTQLDSVYDKIIELAVSYGADINQIEQYMDTQCIVDFLITNRDRHQNNIGFLRDNNTLKIISYAPVFDSGSSRLLEGESSESLYNTKVNGLYSTEIECLSHVKDFNRFNLDLLPNREFVKSLLEHTIISEDRKHAILNLYEQKIEFLRKLQSCKNREEIKEVLYPKVEEKSFDYFMDMMSMSK